jgi:putative secretion ATPase (PEP-CTERM system associated)
MYDQFYGLTGRPFQLTPDPQYYFESGTHRKALSYLGYGLAQGEGFIVITGDVGAGKSTLVGHLMQTIDKSRLTATNIVTSQLDGNDMVQMAAESFGIHTHGQDKAATLKAIENYLHAEARAGRRCLLIVDEAQNLSINAIEELRMLSNFQLGSQALLQIFLLGQPEFRDLVQSSQELEQLRQRIIATHHLQPMEADEVEPYIVHRLSRAGWTGNPQFTPEAIATLYAHTDGVPRKLNTLLSRVLLMGAVEQLNIIDGELITAVIADMAGQPFEYEAPMSTRGEVALELVEETHGLVEETQAPVQDVEPEEVRPFAHFEPAAEMADGNSATIDFASRANGNGALHHYDAGVMAEEAPEPHSGDELLSGRIDALELRIAEQDQALRRVLAMMIDWMDKESAPPAHTHISNRVAWN